MENLHQYGNAQICQMKYKVRAGTIDSGKKYEFKMAALLSLRCILKPEDMWMSSNADGVGAFDDIVLRQGDKIFMLQLKHKDDPKPLLERKFLAPKGDFALSKYLQDIIKLKQSIESKSKKSGIVDYLGTFNNIYFVLFTNRDVKLCKFLNKNCDRFVNFLNTSTSTEPKVYKIKITQVPEITNLDDLDCSNNIFLFAKQSHAKNIDQQIVTEIEKVAENFHFVLTNVKDIAEKFVKYITDWAEGNLGGHYCLTKQDVLCKLTELFLHQYETKLSENKFPFYADERKCVWNQIIQDKTMTVVDFESNTFNFLLKFLSSEVRAFCGISKNFWAEYLSEEEKNNFYQKCQQVKTYMLKIVGNAGKINLVNVYKCLWMDKKLPVLLEITRAHQYDDILNILKLSSHGYKVLVINKSGKHLSLIKCGKLNGFTTLQDLRKEDKNQILKQEVTFQGRSSVRLGKLIDPDMFQDIQCKDIISILLGSFNIGNDLHPLPNYFIHRSVSKVFIQTKVLNELRHEIFLVEEDLENFFEMLSVKRAKVSSLEDVDFNNISQYQIITTRKRLTKEQIQKLKTAKRTIHYVGIHDPNHLEWRASFGSIKNLKRFRVELEDITESDIRNKFFSPANIISASPGMGKSILMDFVAQQAPLDKWIIQINLSEHQQYYKNLHRIVTESSKHLEYFNNELLNQKNCNTRLNTAIFQKFASTKDVVVLLDGFDEVSPSFKEEVTNIAKSLHNEGYGLWLTTRPHLKTHLEEEFNAFSITLTPFSINNQKQFLTKYFSGLQADSAEISIKLVNKFVEKLLSAARNNLNDKDAEFTGIALQTKLLADVFKDDFKNYLSSSGTSKFSETFDLLDLYRNFIDKKIDIVQDKFGTAARDVHVMSKEHQSLFAIKVLFPSREELLIDITKRLEDYYRSDSKKIQILQREGLVTVDEDFNVNFVHRTFGEYLAAEWLAENFNSSNKKLKEISRFLVRERCSGDYKFLFNLFDRIVCKKCPLHLALVNKQIDEALGIIDSDPKQIIKVDESGRSILHLIALYGQQYIQLFSTTGMLTYESTDFLTLEKFNSDDMLGVIKKVPCEKLAHITIDCLGYTPLDYALLNRSLNIAEKICAKLNISTINVDIPINLKEDFLGYCAILDYKLLLDALLEYFAFADVLLLKTKRSNSQYSLSRFAIYHDDDYFSIIEDYTAYFKMLFNTVDHYNGGVCLQYALAIANYEITTKSRYATLAWSKSQYYTLSHAIFYGSKEDIDVLLSKGADINKRDVYHNTPLHYAVVCNKPEIVNKLLDTGAEVNVQNADGDTPLHLAAVGDDELSQSIENRDKVVRKLLFNGCKINVQNTKGETALYLSLLKNKLSFTELLISNGADVNLKNEEGKTVLHVAVTQNGGKILAEVLSRAADIDKQDNKGCTPLFYAVRDQNINTINSLLLRGANVNLEDARGQNVLHLAATGYNNDILVAILSKAVEIDKQDSLGWTPLFQAVIWKNLNAINLLLSNGANVNLEDVKGQNVLHVAARYCWNDIVSELLSKGVDLNKQDDTGQTPLFTAVIDNKLDMVKLLVCRGANVDIRNNDGETIFDVAENCLSIDLKKALENIDMKEHPITMDTEKASNSEKICVNLDNQHEYQTIVTKDNDDSDTGTPKLPIFLSENILVEHNNWNSELHGETGEDNDEVLNKNLNEEVDNSKQRVYSNNLISHAASNQNTNTETLFTFEAVNVDLITDNGKNVLHFAAAGGNDIILNEILHQEDINKQDINGWTPLFYAVHNNNRDIAKLLISHGADINLEDINGRTVLHVGAEKGNNEILNEMLFNEVDIDKQDSDGNTPLCYSVHHNKLYTTKLLISNGADVNLGKVLHLAAINNNYDILCAILSRVEIEINKQDSYGWTPLFYAVIRNSPDAVELLISRGSNMTIRDNSGRTVFDVARQENLNNILELLSKNIDIDEQRDDRVAPHVNKKNEKCIIL